SVSPATAKVQSYEKANPSVKNWNRSWSRVPHGPIVRQLRKPTSVRRPPPRQEQFRPKRGGGRRRRRGGPGGWN
ncbi:MAG: hypothetical protein ACXVBW_09695, partial [Bdellovibrionota bacterium]